LVTLEQYSNLHILSKKNYSTPHVQKKHITHVLREKNERLNKNEEI